MLICKRRVWEPPATPFLGYFEEYFLFLFRESLSGTISLLLHLQTDFRTMKTTLCRILILMEQKLIKQNGGFFFFFLNWRSSRSFLSPSLHENELYPHKSTENPSQKEDLRWETLAGRRLSGRLSRSSSLCY